MKWLTIVCIGVIAGCSFNDPKQSPVANEALTEWQQALRDNSTEVLQVATTTQSELRSNTTTLSEIKAQLDTIEASLASPKTDNSEEVIQSVELTSADKNANDSQPVTGSVAESAGVSLLISTTSGCAPCEQLKRDLEAGLFAGFDVRFVDDWQPRLYPAIRFRDIDSASGWAAIYGYDNSTLPWLRARLLGNAVSMQAVASRPAVRQSQGDLIALHNQLHGGGSWTWPGDLATHLRESHGVATADQSSHPVRYSGAVIRPVSYRQSKCRWSGAVAQRACPTCPR